MNIEITTRDLSNLDEPPTNMIIDDTVKFQQQWFIRHWWWAMRTNRSVTMHPTDEPVTFVDRRKPREETAT